MSTVDIAIIGGGIAGAGMAAALTSLTSEPLSIVVLEQESTPGYHSTGRSAATWIQSYGNDCIRELNIASYADLDGAATTDTGLSDRSYLSQRGLLLCSTGSDEDELELSHLLGNPQNGVEEISENAAIKLVPVLRTERYQRYVFEAGACDIDVARLHQDWFSRLRQTGGELICNARITALERVSGRWKIHAGERSWDASVVVNAAGAWADHIGHLAGAGSLSLTPTRRSAAILTIDGKHDVSGWPLFAEVSETWYAKPEAEQLMVSPADEDPVDAGDAWHDDEVLAAGIDRFERAINGSVSRVLHRWAGLRTFAPDKTPVVGFDGDLDDFFWLAGHGGYGIQTAPALSRFAAELLINKASNRKTANRNLTDMMSATRTFIT